MVKEIDVKNWNRYKTYSWFKSFSNSTYGCNKKIDVTELVNVSKKRKQSFFINMLYVVLKALNSVDEMRMRMENGVPVIYEDINPAFTVMTKAETFENVRFENCDEYNKFYLRASDYIEKAKNQQIIEEGNYNPNIYNEYYITCVPWLSFEGLTHPIPDDVSSQCVPRVCWGKYENINGKYELTLNITVSHIFVDGYPLSRVFNLLQEMLNNVEDVLN